MFVAILQSRWTRIVPNGFLARPRFNSFLPTHLIYLTFLLSMPEDKYPKVCMCCDILLSWSQQRSFVHLVAEVTGKRPSPPVASIQRKGLIPIVDRKQKTFAKQACSTLHPAQRIQVNFCAPAIAKARPGY